MVLATYICSFIPSPPYVAKYLIKSLSEICEMKKSINYLRGIIRFCKKIFNPERFKSHANAEELATKSRKLVSGEVPEAKDWLKDVNWVMSG